MSLGRAFYRGRQFFLVLRARVPPGEMDLARAFLPPAQGALLIAMHPSEQAHALSVYRQLVDRGETSSDLLTAALLHDVGKSCCPLRLWERVVIVLAKGIFPAQVKRWGSYSSGETGCHGLKRAFVIAEMHPIWGANLAAGAGASARAVVLIRQHQAPLSMIADPEIVRLLAKLQAVDDIN